MQDEERLVRLAQEGDEGAMAQIYELYFDKIYRYVTLKTGDRAEAEDITQQVFIKVLRSISSFRWKGVSFSAWLYRIAHNQVVDYLRKRGKRVTVPLDDDPVISDDNPQLKAERNFEIEQLAQATRHLTKAQSEVISLRFAAELPVAEVARIMGKSEGAIKALQHSAVAALRRVLTVV